MRIKGMVMHVGEIPEVHSQRDVKKKLSKQKGVMHAYFNEPRPGLVLIAYDRERTSSLEILAGMSAKSMSDMHAG